MMTAIVQRRRLLLTLGFLASAAIYGTWLAPMVENWVIERSRDAGFVLSDLQITGVERSKRADVLAALDVDDGVPLLTMNLEAMRQQLEQLPWVKEAQVTRVLPEGLKVVLTERQPFALWQKDGKVSLIDETGTIITQRGLVEYSDLMMIVGEGAADKIGELQGLLDGAGGLAARVRTAVRVGNRRWDMIFDNGIRVKLPEMTAKYSASQAWKKFATLEDEYHLLGREVDVIDMRLSDRMVLRVSPEGRRRMSGTGWAT
ncbi:cell division protein FtsQ/DivIB [Kordiimonas lipolytica]|uniref:Cell division protein FtsQ n=1 Tax=Kordiimonas lipolytica TaxID=1662421 RepID=A0ABV8UAN4_9PROT|nr:cell division protein FtsQ/DivIB [Kordiimonas lipolytica]